MRVVADMELPGAVKRDGELVEGDWKRSGGLLCGKHATSGSNEQRGEEGWDLHAMDGSGTTVRVTVMTLMSSSWPKL